MAENSLDLPLSVDRVEQRDPLGRLQVNLSESLLGVPGISAQSRQNYAQDIQLSVRGFGARSSFGVRGVRIYADGIPGTMPDGQGQFSHFDLGSANHIEVLCGPFSALYGNSSGGVIALFTEDGKPGNTLQGSAALGSFATRRYALKDSGDTGGVNYLIDAAHFATQGYRDHSAAERNNLNAKLRIALNGGAKLTLVANALETPFVQDPLGLSSSQLVYAGRRATTQYQAILRSVELASLKNPGGVIDAVRDYWGTDANFSDTRGFANGFLTTTAGINYDALQEACKSFLNFNGNLLGVEGALRRDEVNHVYDFDQYLQTQWEPSAKWLMLAGVRNSLVAISTRPVSGVASFGPGRVQYRAANPVAGLTYRATPNLNFYASYGRGFETPTLNDLAYRSTSASLPGLNIGLKPVRSNNSETGVKIGDQRQRLNLALFNIVTDDELAVLANAGGRSVFQNINQTRRQGVEVALEDSSAVNGPYGVVKTRLAYTYLDAVNKSSYGICVALPCI